MSKKTLLTAAITSIGLTVFGQPITSFQNPEGYSNYHYSGQVFKVESGFIKGKIMGRMVPLQKVGEKQYDILFVDAYKPIISATGDDGTVVLLRKGIKDATLPISKLAERSSFIHFGLIQTDNLSTTLFNVRAAT